VGKLMFAIGSMEFEGSGSEALQEIGKLLSRVLPDNSVAVPLVALSQSSPETTAEEPVEIPKYPDEPDGFRMPEPAPTRAKHVVDHTRNAKTPFQRPRFKKEKKQGTPKEPQDKVPGILASRIIQLLDGNNGVAPFEWLREQLPDCTPQGINMAVTKCRQLKRLEDGRIALVSYEDSDD
jgi:hypothetical protein